MALSNIIDDMIMLPPSDEFLHIRKLNLYCFALVINVISFFDVAFIRCDYNLNTTIKQVISDNVARRTTE